MKVPFLILSYGDYVKTKKLFSFDLNGIHTLPLFTDAEKAFRFVESMNEGLCELPLSLKLQTQICEDQTNAYKIFSIIIQFAQLQQVIVDPSPLVRNDQMTHEKIIELIPTIVPIDEFMNNLYQLKSESISNTLKLPSDS